MLFFITKHSYEIGLGHLSRCYVLAKHFKKKKYKITFIINKSPPQNFYLNDFNLIVEANQNKIINYLKTFSKKSTVIIDSYRFNLDFETSIRSLNFNLIVLDDQFGNKHNCNALIDNNLGVNKDFYKDKVESSTQLLLGETFSIIDSKFFCYKKKKRDTILINAGGSDPKKLNQFILKALLPLSKKIKVQIVLGSKKDLTFELRSLINLYSNIKVFIQVKNMQKIYNSSYLAIGAGGVSLIERMASGIPSIIITIAENQINASIKSNQKKSGIYIGDIEVIQPKKILLEFKKIYKNKFLIKFYGDRCKKLCNKNGINNIENALKHLLIS